MKIRTAIFGVYVFASAIGFAVLMAFVMHDVRLRYIEAMRRTMGDTAAFLAVFASESPADEKTWTQRLAVLPPKADLLRVFASDPADRIEFDSANGRDVGQIYPWSMTGGGYAASENYTLPNVAIVGGELRVRAPVRFEGRLVGWVGVGRPVASATEGVSRARWRIGWIALGIGAAMAVVGWWIARKLTHSLERLTIHAEAVRDGRASAPPVSRAAEVAALVRAFEEMRVALEGKAHVERYTQALAHELKAPLTSIRGAAELLSEEMPRDDRVRFMANLRTESERLQLIVDRLLELAALEARRDGGTQGQVSVTELVGDICRRAGPAAVNKKIALQCKPEGSCGVRGDKFQLGQAVSNLVQNALEFTPPGGTVAVTVGEHAGRVLVTVEDTGPGVPDYALGKIFDRFYSLPRPDTGRKSSGLGLSIVREIARLHGGEITIENRSGGGARAVLSVPVVAGNSHGVPSPGT